MLVKKRLKSSELMVLHSLILRMNLSKKEKSRFFNLEKGYEGEVQFDQILEENHGDRLILNDLLFEIDHSYFQIDTLIISRGIIYLIDIKNFLGDCYLKDDKLYSIKSRSEYNNPIYQLKRCEALLSQLLKRHKYNYLIKSTVVFINPTFTLYQAPIDQPIVLPSQVSRFVNSLSKNSQALSQGDHELAQKFLSLHQLNNPFIFLPEYTYEKLKKGIYCSHCNSYHVSIEKHQIVCLNCRMEEKTRSAILRHTEEFHLLFPDKNITTNIIYEWCNIKINKKTIRRVLRENYTVMGQSRGTYYVNA